MEPSDHEFDFIDSLEDEALARLRDCDAWSDEETEDDEPHLRPPQPIPARHPQ